ncbi:MAG: transcriptional activator HlyU [Oricola sp.]|nr:transcriptional activator HlyU [Oricola sp.]
MTGFLKRLFGSATNENTPQSDEPDEVYNEVELFARPVKEGGQWRIAGEIRKRIDGTLVERKFMRADLLPDADTAKTATLGKAKLIVDQNGDGLWRGEDRSV